MLAPAGTALGYVRLSDPNMTTQKACRGTPTFQPDLKSVAQGTCRIEDPGHVGHEADGSDPEVDPMRNPRRAGRRWVQVAALAATILAAGLINPSLAQASAAQGVISGSGAVTDDFGD